MPQRKQLITNYLKNLKRPFSDNILFRVGHSVFFYLFLKAMVR